MGQGGERMSEQRASSSRRSTHNKILGLPFPFCLSVAFYLFISSVLPSFPISYNVQRAFASLGGAAAAVE